MRRLGYFVFGAAALAGLGWACFHRDATAESTGRQAPVRGATALVLATPHDAAATTTEVRRIELHADGVKTTTLATIPHPPQAVVRGDARGGTIAVVADGSRATDHDWGATLYRVGASGASAVIDGVGHARRPLVSEDGLVYVERGTSGPTPSEADARAGHLREDPISIAAVDGTGAARSVYSANAYALHLCGELGRELVVYRVRFEGADLLAVDRASGASRLVTTLPPFARDFTIDRAHGALVLSNRDPSDASRWVVDRVDLTTGQTTELHAERDSAPAPFALVGGGFAYTAPARGGLVFSGTTPTAVAAIGPGFDATQAETSDGEWLLVAHVPRSGFDETIALHRPTARVLRLTTSDERIDAIAFDGEGAVVR